MSPSPRSSRRRRGGSPSSAKRRSNRPAPDPLTPTENPPEVETFDEWELGDDVQTAIRDMGIVKPTPIQALAIGEVLEGRDVIAKAETGTGKTLAFGAPLMARIDPSRVSVLGLVLSPTRELSEQVYNVLKVLGEARGVKVALVVGGEPLHPQVRELQAGAQVVVATPGRVIDLMGQGFLSFPWTEFVVLDEADKMLEIGFIDDVRKILEATDPDIRQTLLFSATFPTALLELAREHTRNPAEMATASGVATVDTIEQTFLRADEEDKPRALAMMIENSEPDDVFLVFCERRTDVDKLLRRMERLRFSIKALHGGYDQASRFRVMSAFRTGEVKALLATDVASRGLDVNHVTHVINFGVPRDVSDYTHRIGRTGRAGRQGVSCTLVARSDDRKWRPLISQMPWDVLELDTPRDLRKIGRGDKRAKGDRDDREEAEEEERPRRRKERSERAPRTERDRDEERPRRRRSRRDEDEERPRSRRREREEEEEPARGETRETRKANESRDEAEERPRRRRRRTAEDDAEPVRNRDEESDRRPRRRARSSEDDDREERPRRRTRATEESRETEERPRRSRSREESPEGDEPRTRRTREVEAEESREERPRRRRSSRRDEGTEREERRPPRSREVETEEPREEAREERPRRARQDRSREERPRRRRSRDDSPDRERTEEAPRERSKEEPARRKRERTKTPSASSGDGFGDGLEGNEDRPPSRTRKPRKRSSAGPKDRPREDSPRSDSGGGFGTGL